MNADVRPVLIKGGDAYIAEERTFLRADILLREGCVAQLAPELEVPDGTEPVDAHGCIVTPGLIDFTCTPFATAISRRLMRMRWRGALG